MAATVHVIDRRVGAIIAMHLAARGLKRQELADFIPLDKGSLSRSIDGKRSWKLPELERTAEFLGVTLGGLVDEPSTEVAAMLGLSRSSWIVNTSAA